MEDESLIDTPQQGEGLGLGRLYLEDTDDLGYLMRNFAEIYEAPLPVYKYYWPGPVLDQGQTPQCVEFSWNGWLMASPIRNKKIEPRATLYCEAQKIDPWPGDCSDPKYDGTSVRAGAKVLQRMGRVDTYLWAFTVADIANWLLSGKGPVVFGTRWYKGMFKPDSQGIVHVDPQSGTAGGHAYLCLGYNSRTRMFRFQNSWGTNWGQSGRFWMSADDVEILLQSRGEACTAIEIRSAA